MIVVLWGWVVIVPLLALASGRHRLLGRLRGCGAAATTTTHQHGVEVHTMRKARMPVLFAQMYSFLGGRVIRVA